MRQNRVLFFRHTNTAQVSICVGTLAAPIFMGWLLGISDFLIADARALLAAVLVYLGYVIVVLLIILQVKAESTRGKLGVTKLVGRSSIVDGRLTGISCVVALRSNAPKSIRFALDKIDLSIDSNVLQKPARRSGISVVEPGVEFPFSFDHVSFIAPIIVGPKPKVIDGRLTFRVNYHSNSIFFDKVLGFRFIAAPGRAVAFEWKSLGS